MVPRLIMRLQFRNSWGQRSHSASLQRDTQARELPISAAPLPIDAEWDDAFMRVESYLRAHHFDSRSLLTRLTTEILATARGLGLQSPRESPVETAMRVAQARIGEWLQRSVGEGAWSDERFRARGRLALLMSGVPQRCPEYFLCDEPLPGPEVNRLAGAQLQAGPERRPVGMPPAMVEFPLAEFAEEKWITFSRSTFTRAAASWVFFVGFLAVAWAATR
jgi:hypothetical protein